VTAQTGPQPDRLGRHGGLGLTLFGIALVVLACCFADKTAVAPIFASGGIVCVVLGVVLSRVEGDLELSATGLKARLQAVRTITEREDLTLDEKADEIIEVIEAPRVSVAPRFPRGVEVGSPPDDPVQRALEFERLLRDHLIAEGWTIEDHRPIDAADQGWDMVARRGDEHALVVAKASRRLARADVQRAIAPGIGLPMLTTLILAVRPGALSADARAFLKSLQQPLQVIELA
jgi:hypothetical protein